MPSDVRLQKTLSSEFQVRITLTKFSTRHGGRPFIEFWITRAVRVKINVHRISCSL